MRKFSLCSWSIRMTAHTQHARLTPRRWRRPDRGTDMQSKVAYSPSWVQNARTMAVVAVVYYAQVAIAHREKCPRTQPPATTARSRASIEPARLEEILINDAQGFRKSQHHESFGNNSQQATCEHIVPFAN